MCCFSIQMSISLISVVYHIVLGRKKKLDMCVRLCECCRTQFKDNREKTHYNLVFGWYFGASVYDGFVHIKIASAVIIYWIWISNLKLIGQISNEDIQSFIHSLQLNWVYPWMEQMNELIWTARERNVRYRKYWYKHEHTQIHYDHVSNVHEQISIIIDNINAVICVEMWSTRVLH